MENRLKHLLLGGVLAVGLAYIPAGQTADETVVQVIEPELERREIKTAKIDKENFEIGGFVGIIAIEDFDSSSVYGARLAYHLTEDFFVEATYGQATGDLTSFEQLSGGSPLFSDEDRDFTYYDLSVGWNIFPGEIFIANRFAFNSSFYLVAGAGSTEFAGDDWFTITAGAGYRLLLTDWVALHLDVRDNIFDRDSFGEDEQTHNLQFNTGFTFFF